jgi:hypothetical protein
VIQSYFFPRSFNTLSARSIKALAVNMLVFFLGDLKGGVQQRFDSVSR